MLFDYPDRVVAFLDILGFRTIVQRLERDLELRVMILGALTKIKRYTNFSEETGIAPSMLEVSVFSDSIAISAEEDGAREVIWAAIHLQCELLSIGIPLRGGVAKARTFHHDGVLFGQGMIDAYHLESTAAVYPRIVIAPKLADEIGTDFRAMLCRKDSDGLWFIDPFAMGITPGNAAILLEDGYGPHEEALKSIGKRIDQEIGLLSEPGHLAKWNWLKNQHRIATDEFAELGMPRFWHHMAEVRKRAASAPIGEPPQLPTAPAP